jgi:hypothetical protein
MSLPSASFLPEHAQTNLIIQDPGAVVHASQLWRLGGNPSVIVGVTELEESQLEMSLVQVTYGFHWVGI